MHAFATASAPLPRGRASRVRRLRGDGGFGLVELTFAMAVLSVGLLALIGAFVTGGASLRRASVVSTAGTLAEQQMELYRSTTYCNIALTGDASGNLTSAPASPYQSDQAYSAVQVTTLLPNSWCTTQTPAVNPPYSTCLTTLGTKPSPALNACTASQTVRGADGRPYRVDTYIVVGFGGNAATFVGREVKHVTVVVRDGPTLRELARQVSTFDPATGS